MALECTTPRAVCRFLRAFSTANNEASLVHVVKQFEAIKPEKRDKDAFTAAIGTGLV